MELFHCNLVPSVQAHFHLWQMKVFGSMETSKTITSRCTALWMHRFRKRLFYQSWGVINANPQTFKQVNKHESLTQFCKTAYIGLFWFKKLMRKSKSMARVRSKTEIHFLDCALDCRGYVNTININSSEAGRKAEA